jgi:hypothetical protein
MSQPIQFNIQLSPWHVVAGAFLFQFLFKDRLAESVGSRLYKLFDKVEASGKNLLLDFPVIALTTGITYAVHPLTRYAPALEISPEGAMQAATYVGGVFALKSALTPFLEHVTKPKDREEITHGTMLRNTVVLHFLPVVLGTFYAYYASIPVNLTRSALYITALIPTIKLLGKGIDSFCAMEGVKERIEEWYAWMDLEKSVSKSSGIF